MRLLDVATRYFPMSSLQKKTILRRFNGSLAQGYLPASGFVNQAQISYLDLEGRVTAVPLQEIKTVSYVRDFNLSDAINPERLMRRSFIARPRGEGLWIRLTFRDDDDVLEGLAATDVALLDGLTADSGIYLSPPDTRANTQRIFVPRSAIALFEILSVIKSPSRRQESDTFERRASRRVEANSLQEQLFEGAPDVPSSRGKHGR